jgi:hypothetical protein
LALADCLALKLSQRTDWPLLATEWILDSPQIVSLDSGQELRFRGRIDLVLGQNRPNKSGFDRSDVWIVDYKTGNHKALTASSWKTNEARSAGVRKKLIRGDAIQLGLYALAARELGANDIWLSLLSTKTDLDRPQLSLGDITAQSDFWTELHRMQENGLFGRLDQPRSEFNFGPPYPLATLPIDSDLLRERWAVTHPDLVEDEAEDRS